MRVLMKSILCGNVAGVHTTFSPGDVADVPDDEARALVAGGYAESAEPASETKPKAETKAKAETKPKPEGKPAAKEAQGGTEGRKPARRQAARS